MPVWAPSTLPPSTPFLLSPPLAPSLLVVAVGPLDQHRVPGNSVFTPTAAVLLRRSSVADVFFLSLLFLSFSFSLFLPLPHPSSYPVEIKVIKDLPWPPPVGQLNSGETPPDGEASASVPPQHGPQSYEDANGGCRMTAGIRGGCSRCLLGRCQLCATHCRSPSPPSPPFSSSSSPLACLSWAGHKDVCPCLFHVSSYTMPLCLRWLSCTREFFSGSYYQLFCSLLFASKFPAFDSCFYLFFLSI